MTDDATPALDLVRNADLAMYTAKRDGGACHRLYVDTMHDAAIARLDLTADLDRTLDEGALDVVYQPVVLLGSRDDHRLRGAGPLAAPAARCRSRRPSSSRWPRRPA